MNTEDPRGFSVAVELKDIDRTEFYAGFVYKSSPKITLFPKSIKRASQAIRSPVPRYASPNDALVGSIRASARSTNQSPAPARDMSATWVCLICGLANAVPQNFDPSTANQHTPLPSCQACGIKPSLVTMVKAAIAAMSNRTAGASPSLQPSDRNSIGPRSFDEDEALSTAISDTLNACPRCTFQNHPSLTLCEICGAPLSARRENSSQQFQDGSGRSESPDHFLNGSIIGDESIETIKFSFRAGGEKTFLERLKGALVQRKWLLQGAPPVPKPTQSTTPNNESPWSAPEIASRTSTPQRRVVGIAGLERREAELRENNKTVISTAFEDLEALMTSAKEVIAMAEQFAKQTDGGSNAEDVEARTLLSDSAAALGIVTTRDMLGSGSASESLYITELSRNLAEFLTDDRKSVLRKEGGIMSLVDLWSVFNRTRNGIELISPLDFEKAATMWESLHLPIRLRRFKSGLLVVQEKNRTDLKTIASLLSWLREPQYTFPPAEADQIARTFGRGATAQDAAERFGWSVGVATEELEMAEEVGALCRDHCIDGTRFWENHFMQPFSEQAGVQPAALPMMNELSI